MTVWTNDYPLTAYDDLQTVIDDVETEQARYLGSLLKSMFKPLRVIDVGCASGLYLLPFRPAKIVGVDGAPAAGRRLKPSEYYSLDLREFLPNWRPVYGARKPHDLALCIEVAEHLPAWCAAPLVAYLCSLAPVVVFSAARPGQGGTGHLNERPAEYWRGLFAASAFAPHALDGQLRGLLRGAPGVLPWLVANVVLMGAT